MNESEHYFSATPEAASRPRTIEVTLAGRSLRLTTDAGVFSPQHVDTGTAVLLEHVPAPPTTGELLDLGCGWGPIALSLALLSPDARVWAVDVNERALNLVRANAHAAGVSNIVAVTPHEVPSDVKFDTVWSNPPIRIGKNALHDLLLTWLPRLADKGDAWLVVQRNLGSDSLQRWLLDSLPEFDTTREVSSKGFRVLRTARS